MKIMHVSFECYPAAKVGGLADVVGALPKYLNYVGAEASVIMPKHDTKWMRKQAFAEVHRGFVWMGNQSFLYVIEQLWPSRLDFPLFVVRVADKFDRENVYTDENGQGYGDEIERSVLFQQAVMHWFMQLPPRAMPDIVHCHDHHVGLMPFFMKHSLHFSALKNIPTVFTIHNGEYNGSFPWDRHPLLPTFHSKYSGLIEWAKRINPLAAGIKNSWSLTTVSPGYLQELMESSNGMEVLIQSEWRKSVGILNGIDNQVWDPQTDAMLPARLEDKNVEAFKEANKSALHDHFHFHHELPVIAFIGRLVGEKGADLIPNLIERFIHNNGRAAFLLLGTGNPWVEDQFRQLTLRYPGFVSARLEYNEAVAHQMYAGSDFLFMPSRVEPCGLNQMYALRYGGIPIVRAIGGLRDSVRDIGDDQGYGIRFWEFSVEDAEHALHRAVALYHNRAHFETLRKYVTTLDFSWERSAQQYIDLYASLMERVG